MMPGENHRTPASTSEPHLASLPASNIAENDAIVKFSVKDPVDRKGASHPSQGGWIEIRIWLRKTTRQRFAPPTPRGVGGFK